MVPSTLPLVLGTGSPPQTFCPAAPAQYKRGKCGGVGDGGVDRVVDQEISGAPVEGWGWPRVAEASARLSPLQLQYYTIQFFNARRVNRKGNYYNLTNYHTFPKICSDLPFYHALCYIVL